MGEDLHNKLGRHFLAWVRLPSPDPLDSGIGDTLGFQKAIDGRTKLARTLPLATLPFSFPRQILESIAQRGSKAFWLRLALPEGQ